MSFGSKSLLFSQIVLSRQSNRVRQQPAPYVPMLTLFVALTATTVSATDPAVHDLTPKNPAGSLQRVHSVLEVNGKLRLNPDGKKVVELPLQLIAHHEYAERFFSEGRGGPLAVRHYSRADADIRIDGNQHQPSLGDDRRLVAVAMDDSHARLYSPLGPFSRDDLELIDIQGNSALIARLLPGRPLKVGENWAIDSEILGPLLGLDVVSQAEVRAKLTKIEDGSAVIEWSGPVHGAVGGVSSEIDLKAKLNFHLKQRCVTWVAMAIQEDRAIGHAEAGFKVTARLRMALAPAEQAAEVSDAALGGLPLDYNLGAALLEFASPAGHFRCLHDRRWRVMTDEQAVTILRLVDHGDLIAQCNLSNVPPLSPGKQLTLEAFQQDIQRSLGKQFLQFTEASESLSGRGLRVLRAVATGNSSGLPIIWAYYHFSDDEGRRMAAAFTLEERLEEQFAEADQILVNSIEFTPRPERAASKPGEKDAESPSQR